MLKVSSDTEEIMQLKVKKNNQQHRADSITPLTLTVEE